MLNNSAVNVECEMPLQNAAPALNKTIPNELNLSDSGINNPRQKNRNRVVLLQQKRKKERLNDDENGSDGDDEEDPPTPSYLTQSISNPFELLHNWPSLGKGNHSNSTTTHHEWIRFLTPEIAALKDSKEAVYAKLTKLEKEVKDKDVEIADLKEKVSMLQGQVSTSVTREQKNIEKRENNLIIFNVPESSKDKIEDIRKDDQKAVVSILNEIQINESCLKRIFRMKKSDKSPKPAPIVMELNNNVNKHPEIG